MLFDVLLGRVSFNEYIKSLKLKWNYKIWKTKNPYGNKPLKMPLKFSNMRVVDEPNEQYPILIGEIENQSVRRIKDIFSEIQIGDYSLFIIIECIEPFDSYTFSYPLSNRKLNVSTSTIVSKEVLLNKPIKVIGTTYEG